jgi:hypothetical protein
VGQAPLAHEPELVVVRIVQQLLEPLEIAQLMRIKK